MFEETLKAFDECLFDFSYNARYSVREGTIASKLYPDDVPEKEKSRRWHILNDKLLETLTKRNTMML
jgi:tRNA-2-methylthio-N6-dimethylallyladenosine synthase